MAVNAYVGRKLLFTNKEYEQAMRFLAHQEDEDRDYLPVVPDEDAPECCGRDGVMTLRCLLFGHDVHMLSRTLIFICRRCGHAARWTD